MQQSYFYGTPYLGTTAGTTGGATSGLMQIPASQLSHAAAIAAATSQFYEYQVGVDVSVFFLRVLNWDFIFVLERRCSSCRCTLPGPVQWV